MSGEVFDIEVERPSENHPDPPSPSTSDSWATAQTAGVSRSNVPSAGENTHEDGPTQAGRKRKRRGTVTYRQPRAKRLKGHYLDEYRVFYNTAVKEARERFKCDFIEPLRPSQIGSTFWTAEEKELFFGALAKLGKDATRDIASAIGSKSELEVRSYQLLLKNGFTEHVMNDRRQFVIRPAKMPAAAEISEKCCDGLDMAGEALALFQNNYDEKTERKSHGRYWLLDSAIARNLEQSLRRQESGSDGATSDSHPDNEMELDDSASKEAASSISIDHVPAAKLLKLQRFLDLSENIFMNSGADDLADNWHTIAEGNEEPSIFFTAFEDIHRLTVSLTKRLVLACLFQATCRLRAEDGYHGHIPAPQVLKRDVIAAIDILNMKRNAKEFWARSPRRCRVQVLAKKGDEVPLTYDEVEQHLGFPNNLLKLGQDEQEADGDISSAAEDAGLDHERASNADDDSDSAITDNTDLSVDSVTGFRISKAESVRRKLEAEENEYAERLDQANSLREERELWEMLQLSNPFGPESPQDPSALPKPRQQRKFKDEILDWRDATEYHAPWEEMRAAKSMDDASTDARPVAELRKTYLAPPPSQSHVLPMRQASQGRVRQQKSQQASQARAQPKRLLADVSSDGESSEGPARYLRSSPPVPRVLAPRKARESAVSQIQGTEYMPDAEASSEEFDPMEEDGL